MDELWAYILVSLFLVAVIFVVIEYAINKDLRWKLQHGRKMVEGHFRLKVSKEKWNEAMEQGAIAIAMTNKSGVVQFTLVIEKEQKEVEKREEAAQAARIP